MTDLCQTFPSSKDCSSLREHQINIRNSTVDFLLWLLRRKKTESSLLRNLAAETGQHTPKFGASSPCALAPAPALGTQGLGTKERPWQRRDWRLGCRPTRSIRRKGGSSPGSTSPPTLDPPRSPPPDPLPLKQVTWLGLIVVLLLIPSSLLLLGSGSPFRVTGPAELLQPVPRLQEALSPDGAGTLPRAAATRVKLESKLV